MKVRELIELLKMHDPDDRVGIVVFEKDREHTYHKEVTDVCRNNSEPRARVGIEAGLVFGDPLT